MVRLLLPASVLACLFTSAAQAECNASLLTFTGYSMRPLAAEAVEIATTFKSNASKPIRMLDAMATYRDALGASIGSFRLNRDVSIPVGGEYREVKKWGQFTHADRLPKLKPSEVSLSVCVKAVLYEDGTKETFGD